MLIYLFVFFFSSIFFVLSDKLINSSFKVLGYLFGFIGILLPSILAGCRDLNVGVDVLSYIKPSFDSVMIYTDGLENSRFEFLFSLLVTIITKTTKNIFWVLFSLEFLTISVVFLAATKMRKYIPIWFVMFIYLFIFYNASLNLVRQSVAMAFCLYSFSYLINGQKMKSILAFLPAIGFHTTVFIYPIVIYALYFLISKSKSKKQIITYEVVGLFFAFIILIGLDQLLLFFIITGILPAKFTAYSSTGYFGSNFPLSDFAFSIFFLLSLLFSYYKKKKGIMYYFFQYVALVCVTLCFSALISTFAVRSVYYFTYLSMIIIPMLFYENKKLRQGRQTKLLFIFTLFFMIFYWYMSFIYSNFGETYPYSSKILGID